MQDRIGFFLEDEPNLSYDDLLLIIKQLNENSVDITGLIYLLNMHGYYNDEKLKEIYIILIEKFKYMGLIENDFCTDIKSSYELVKSSIKLNLTISKYTKLSILEKYNDLISNLFIYINHFLIEDDFQISNKGMFLDKDIFDASFDILNYYFKLNKNGNIVKINASKDDYFLDL